MSVQRINYSTLGLPVGPYSHAVISQGQLFTSGMTAFGSDAQTGTISEQAIEVFSQLDYICQQQNTSLDNLVKVTLFVSDMSDIQALREALFNIYQGNIPASSMIQVAALFSDDLSIEVEAIIAV